MKNFSSALQSALASRIAKPALCVTLTVNGVVKRYVNHTAPITLEGEIFSPFIIKKIGSAAEAMTLRLSVALTGEERAVIALPQQEAPAFPEGALDGATVKIHLCSAEAPEAGAAFLFSGYVTAIEYQASALRLLCISDKARLRNPVTRRLTRECSARWGDAACGFDRNTVRATLSVAGVTGAYAFSYTLTNGTFPDLSAAPYLQTVAGDIIPVRLTDKSATRIETALPHNVKTGDQIFYYPGCDSAFSSCKAYNNTQNYRGFPFLPDKNLTLTF